MLSDELLQVPGDVSESLRAVGKSRKVQFVVF